MSRVTRHRSQPERDLVDPTRSIAASLFPVERDTYAIVVNGDKYLPHSYQLIINIYT